MHRRSTVNCYHKNYCKVEIKFRLNEDGDFYFQLGIFFHYGLYNQTITNIHPSYDASEKYGKMLS